MRTLTGAGSERYLYFFFNPWTGLIKVGIANDVANRLETLECVAGVRLQVLNSLKGADYLEKPLHQALFATREVGEWFRPSEDLLAIVRAPSREAINALILKNQPAVQAHLAELFARDEVKREAQAAIRAVEREKRFKEAERKRRKALAAEERKKKRKAAEAKRRTEDLRIWREANAEELRKEALVVNEPFPEAALVHESESQRLRNQQLIGLARGVQ